MTMKSEDGLLLSDDEIISELMLFFVSFSMKFLLKF